MKNENDPTASAICFGLDRATDESSLRLFLQKFCAEALLARLIPRLTEAEIQAAVQLLTGLLHAHLSEKEYHQLFLGDRNPSSEEGRV